MRGPAQAPRILDDILFVHPKDVQDRKVEIGPNDVTTNLPYSADAAISFDHHSSEATRVGGPRDNHVIVPDAQSAARVVYDYYGGEKVFPGITELMDAVDKATPPSSASTRSCTPPAG